MSNPIHPKVPALLKPRANPTGRTADPRRTIPLNSGAWQRLRASVLEESPLCRDCERLGHVTPATDIDHHDGNPGNNERSNLVPLCHACHSHKTMRERHGHKPVYGYDAKGRPLDPDHHWNAAPGAATQAVEALATEKSLATEIARPSSPHPFNAKGK